MNIKGMIYKQMKNYKTQIKRNWEMKQKMKL